MGTLLDGRVAIVTGGGAGIGRGIVERFVAEGARVVVAEVDSERASDVRATLGATVVTEVGDVRERGAGARLVAAARATFGPPNVLVNNVGHFGGPRQAFHEQSDADWDDLYRVNLGHVLDCSRAVIADLVGRGAPGSIVNISTVEAFRAIPTRAVYSAFKTAITGLTRSLAVEYGHAGIRVNAIAPDVTETPQVPYSQWLSAADREMVPAWVPVGRLGQPHDAAGAVLFLASDLSAFVTGTTIPVDGGTLASSGWFPTAEGGWTNRPRRP